MRILNLLTLLLVLFSCNPSDIEKGEMTFIDRTPEKEVVKPVLVVNPILTGEAKYNFQTLYDYILKPKCIGCHNESRGRPSWDPVILTSYNSLLKGNFVPVINKGKPEESTLYSEVFKGSMPPKVPLEEVEIQYIRDWIEKCAPEVDASRETCND